MSDKPILFSAPMVRALLDGRKTQTRRILKPQPDDLYEGQTPKQLRISIGDRLWVRESLSVDWEEGESYDPMGGVRESACGVSYGFARGPSIPYNVYAADNEYVDFPEVDVKPLPMRGIPSIHMPKWASRLTLTVTDVRVERLQDISEEDARAEGCPVTWDGKPYDPPPPEVDSWQGYGRYSYCLLWSKINGPGSWDANPWVACYTFTVHRGNIDEVSA